MIRNLLSLSRHSCSLAVDHLDRNDWMQYDATLLIADAEEKLPLLIDQGTGDEYLSDQLKPAHLEQVSRASHYPLKLRMQEGYDHSYCFIATFIEDHLRHHAEALLPGHPVPGRTRADARD